MPIISAIAADEIEQRREPIIHALARHLAQPNTVAGEELLLAGALLDSMLATLRGTAAGPVTGLAIDRKTASCFGDGLVPILKDVVGPGLPPSALARVTDAYWQTIAGVEHQPQ